MVRQSEVIMRDEEVKFDGLMRSHDLSRTAMLLIAAASALRFASGSTVLLSYIALAGLAVLGRQNTIYALALSWFFSMLNPELVPEGSAGLGRYFVIAGGLVAVAMEVLRGQRYVRVVLRDPAFLVAVLLWIFVIGHSILVSPMLDVSLLKITSWLFSVLIMITAWFSLDDALFDRTVEGLYKGLAAVAFLSVPLLFLRSGYSVNGTGFQGVLNHPQGMGMTMAFLSVWAIARVLTSVRVSGISYLVAGIASLFVVLSEARTGGLSVFFSLSAAVFWFVFFSPTPLSRTIPGLSGGRAGLLYVAAAAALVAFGPQLMDFMHEFLSKSGRADVGGVVDAYDKSRGLVMYRMLSNIQEEWVVGIGFGVPSIPGDLFIQRDPVFGIPIGASIEKGVAPLAVVEELGVAGAIIVFAWISVIFSSAAAGGFVATSVLLCALCLNLGEYVIFSPGGQGLLLLLLVSLIYVNGRRKAKGL